jgi:phosphatidylserine decarboxylase
MSIFSVHVNRIPISGKIAKIMYHSGRFFSANLDKASTQNESNWVILETLNGQKIMIIQIAGLIARRIACWIDEGDMVRAGQRFGLIRFGSRLDVYLPQDIRIVARRSQKVRAGESILGYLA